MLKKVFVLALLALSLGGCAHYVDVSKQQMAALPQHYAQFDALIGWRVTSVGGQTVIDGLFKNLRYTAMEDVEIWVAAFDAAGKTKARSVSYPLGEPLRLEDAAPFSVKLKVPAVPGTKLRFTYKYLANEGGGRDGGGGNWMQSFDAVIPELPPAAGP
jgi:hypothetical protein